LDLLFVDVEKNLYPEVLRMSRRKLRGGGLAVFHNAIALLCRVGCTLSLISWRNCIGDP
jgi:predicted lysophospholipase L1 biosynthesis ABC-type transport system permease subunit